MDNSYGEHDKRWKNNGFTIAMLAMDLDLVIEPLSNNLNSSVKHIFSGQLQLNVFQKRATPFVTVWISGITQLTDEYETMSQSFHRARIFMLKIKFQSDDVKLYLVWLCFIFILKKLWIKNNSNKLKLNNPQTFDIFNSFVFFVWLNYCFLLITHSFVSQIQSLRQSCPNNSRLIGRHLWSFWEERKRSSLQSWPLPWITSVPFHTKLRIRVRVMRIYVVHCTI